MKEEELVDVIRKLNPRQEPGKITLIARYGATKVRELLPKHIKAVQNANLKVVWCCDPMHGNTELTSTGIKTRKFENILEELKLNFEIHKNMGSRLGGVHFELTGDCVTGTFFFFFFFPFSFLFFSSLFTHIFLFSFFFFFHRMHWWIYGNG